MPCAHDPYQDVCESCDRCLGCDAHAAYCPTLPSDTEEVHDG